MNQSKIEAGQPEQQPNSEQTADNISVSPDIGNTNVSSSSEKYIINFEDGQNYIADNYTESDVDAMNDGLLSIIRVSDCKILMADDLWIDLPKWEN